MSHVPLGNESCPTCEWVMAHTLVYHDTNTLMCAMKMCIYESCPTWEWVMSHLWMSHGTHISVSWHKYSYEITTHIKWGTCVRMNESCPTCKWVMAHIWVCHDPHIQIHDTRPTDTSDKRHVFVWMSHVPRVIESWHTYECVMTPTYRYTTQKHMR